MASPDEDREWLRDPEGPRVPSLGWQVSGRADADADYIRTPATVAANALRVFPDRSLLHRFVNLREADARAIAAFVRRWGPLGLCQHGRSPAHASDGPPSSERCARRIDDGFAVEPAGVWRSVAHEARAVLNLATAIHAGRPGEEVDWKSVGVDNWRLGVPRANLTVIVNRWLEIGAVVPRLTALNDKATKLGEMRIVLDGDGLLGGIAGMLILAVARTEGIIPCQEVGCPRLAEPARRGAIPYCAEHLDLGVRGRDRSARWRSK